MPMLRKLSTLWPWLLLSANASPTRAPAPVPSKGLGLDLDLDLQSLLLNNTHLWSTDTILSFPGTEAFTNATSRWTTSNAPSYRAAITPATEEDVAAAVRLATSSRIPFLVSGGRHGFTSTLGDLQHGLSIDLSEFDSYEINEENATITIGASTSIGDIYEPLYEKGFMIQSGSASCPGIIGLSLGAGVGRYMGYFGLVADGLLSARFVSADGQILDVSENENSDLFWGIRGAGANLGVVVSATFKVHRMEEHNDGNLLTADFIFEGNNTQAYFEYLEGFGGGNMPANVAAITQMGWNATINETQLLANWVYIGPESSAREFLSPIQDLHPISSTISYIPWTQLLATVGGSDYGSDLCARKQYRNFYTINLREYHAPTYQETFERLDQFYRENPDLPRSYAIIEAFANQATRAVEDERTAYPWRDAIGFIQIGIIPAVNDTPEESVLEAGDLFARELREMWAATSGYEEMTSYVNYAHGDEGIEQIYGRDKLPRLARLKREWDPTGAFGWNNRLPMEYP